MARKAVLKLMLNKGDAPMSVEMQEAIKYDQSVILDEQGTHRYVDNEKPTDQEKLDAILEAEKKIEDAEVIDVEYSASGEIAFDK
jgi:recombinational DNA repair protein RecT